MDIGILGTGMVGTTIGTALLARGHAVRLGARSATHEGAAAWAKAGGARASHGSFADAARFGSVVFNCTNGGASVAAIEAAGPAALAGKVLVDVSNPLDFGKGMPPGLFIGTDDSLAERLQRAAPEARVVKALNTINAQLMVDPGRLAGGAHATFVCGDDAAAKAAVVELLRGFGWKQIVDLGPLSSARGTEHYLPLWLRLWGALGSVEFNIAVVQK